MSDKARTKSITKESELDLKNLPPIKYEKEVVIAKPIDVPIESQPSESILPVQEPPKESCWTKFKRFCNIFIAQIVRVVLIGECAFCIYFTSCILDNYLYMLMAIGIFIIVIDGVVIAVKRQGKEYKWFSISQVVFIIIFLITICRLVIYKNLEMQDETCEKYSSYFKSKPTCFQTELTVCKFIEILIQVFLITLVLSRWVLPINEEQVTQEQVSALLLQFLSAGSDIVDFYGCIEDNNIADDKVFVYAILGVFCLSVFQFSLTLTAKKKVSSKGQNVLDQVFGNESWSVALILLTQDLPFLIVRIAIIAKFPISENFSIYYFTLKNAILVPIEFYRIMTVCKEYVKEHTEVKPINKTV